jgi:pyruvate/2-oxoglutarate dehydrogenase complex dihydrolipoamide dehydrogenase (E3) component
MRMSTLERYDAIVSGAGQAGDPLARRAAECGASTGPIEMDMGQVRERKRAIVKSFRARSPGLGAEMVFINAGARPAPGDGKGGPAFTHISDDFTVIRTNLLQGGRARITDRLLPSMVFIDPIWMPMNEPRGFMKDAIFAHPTL